LSLVWSGSTMSFSQSTKDYKIIWRTVMTPDGVYIRILRSTKAPHLLPHFIPNTLLLQQIAYQSDANDVDASLHKDQRIFGILFPYQHEFKQLKNLNIPKNKLVFCSNSDSKRLLFEGMIPKENLKNICSILD
jgi:hypothetical protein